jgi:hypothetical protein
MMALEFLRAEEHGRAALGRTQIFPFSLMRFAMMTFPGNDVVEFKWATGAEVFHRGIVLAFGRACLG